jgi:hypothetical protein
MLRSPSGVMRGRVLPPTRCGRVQDDRGNPCLTLPAAARTAHCASASQGALTKGTPISLSKVIQSSLCCGVTYIVRDKAVPVNGGNEFYTATTHTHTDIRQLCETRHGMVHLQLHNTSEANSRKVHIHEGGLTLTMRRVNLSTSSASPFCCASARDAFIRSTRLVFDSKTPPSSSFLTLNTCPASPH